MNRSLFSRLVMAAAMALLLVSAAACSKKQPPHIEELPNLTLGIAPFTMPRTLGDLLAGALPADQKAVELAVLQGLDDTLTDMLRERKRPFIPISESYKCYATIVKDGQFQGTSLEKWIEVGRCLKADILLVPQLLYWQDREGGPLGVEAPASVTFELFLVDVRTGVLLSRYRFEETQTSLLGNLLTLNKFVARHGQWITANQLAAEGMRAGLEELGL